MYNSALVVHSWLRWIVLLAGLAIVARAAMGLGGKQRWSGADERGVAIFMMALDLQLLIGLLLYFVWSPLVKLAMSDVAAAMRDGDLRFWLVEHLTGMVVAVVLAHVGRAKLRRAKDDAGKHRTVAIFMGIALAAILLSIPWPGMASARPLFRF
jgi:hypothetical protein